MNFNWKHIIKKLGLFKILRLVFIIYLSTLAFAILYADKMLFPYNQSSYDERIKGLQFFTVPTKNRPDKKTAHTKLATRFWPATPESFLVLYFHGNAEDIGQLDPISHKLNQYGLSVLAMDYRGYGLSGGEPSEQACYDDAQALYNKALAMGYTQNNIIIWGRSIGSGSAVDLALHNKAIALILESPFSSAFRVITKYPLFPFDKFNNARKIIQINAPLFIIHGEKDTLIPPWHSKHLFDRHKGFKQRHIIHKAGHNNLWQFQLEPTLKTLKVFLNEPSSS